MKIAVLGSLGFIGKQLCRRLLRDGHEVFGFSRRSNKGILEEQNYTHTAADTTQRGTWQQVIAQTEAAVNLTGQTIFHYWTKRYKQQIYDSRILTTRHLVSAIPPEKNYCLINTSAAGFYGDRSDEPLIETAPPGHDFLAEVCRAWEEEALKAQDKDVRVVLARFGVVLSRHGGAMEKMIPAFNFFVGGPVGTGKQWFPWIHLDDLLDAIFFVLVNEAISGPVNFCGPTPVTNRDMSKTLGRLMSRPSWLPAPAGILSLLLGEFGKFLTASQRVYPEKLLRNGFEFTYTDIEHALKQIVSA